MNISAIIELVLIFVAVMTGALAGGYFYDSLGSFTPALRRPLRLISIGMMIIATGVLLAATITYAEKLGFVVLFYHLPLQVYFYSLYIVGSIFIYFGARRFATHPTKIV